MVWKDIAWLDDIGGNPDRAWERYFRSGRYYLTTLQDCAALSTLALTANRLYATPFLVGGLSPKFIRIAFQVTTLGTASLGRAGIYLDDGTVYPGSLILDGGEQICSTIGMKETVISQTLDPSLYWLVLVVSVACTVRCSPLASLMPILGLDTALGTAPGNGWYAAFTYTELPATFPAGGTINVATMPTVALMKE